MKEGLYVKYTIEVHGYFFSTQRYSSIFEGFCAVKSMKQKKYLLGKYLGEGVGGGALFAPEALRGRSTATDSSRFASAVVVLPQK